MYEWMTDKDFEQIEKKGIGYFSGKRLRAEYHLLRKLLEAVTPPLLTLSDTALMWQGMADHPEQYPESIDCMIRKVADALAVIKEEVE